MRNVTPHTSRVDTIEQAIAGDGPLDVTMMYVVHDALRRDVRALPAAAHLTPVNDRQAWQALNVRWQTVAEALQRHGEMERALWPALAARVEAEAQPVVVACAAELSALDRLVRSCADGFAKVAHDADDDARAALTVRLAAARERVSLHLDVIETEVVELAQRHLNRLEWQAAVRGDCQRSTGARQAIRLLPWLLYDLPGGRCDEALADLGWRTRMLWLLGRHRFERQQRVAFRHVRHA